MCSVKLVAQRQNDAAEIRETHPDQIPVYGSIYTLIVAFEYCNKLN